MEELSFPMIVQHSYIVNAIENNDADAIENLLESMCPKKHEGALPANNIFTIALMLEYASASEGALLLSGRTAELLIDYVAMRVTFGDFLFLFLRRCRFFCSHNLDLLAPELLGIIDSPQVPYNDGLVEMIEQLDKNQFITLMGYIVDIADSRLDNYVMDGCLFQVIIRYIYNHELIPRECIFAYMRMCL